MPRQLTEQERQDFLAEPHVGVLSVAGDDGRPPLPSRSGMATSQAACSPFSPGCRAARPARPVSSARLGS